MVKSGVGKTTTEAQQSAIIAMQTELQTLRGKVEDVTKENDKLQSTIETIRTVLETTKGITVTVHGEIVSIQDGMGSAHIHIKKAEDK